MAKKIKSWKRGAPLYDSMICSFVFPWYGRSSAAPSQHYEVTSLSKRTSAAFEFRPSYTSYLANKKKIKSSCRFRRFVIVACSSCLSIFPQLFSLRTFTTPYFCWRNIERKRVRDESWFTPDFLSVVVTLLDRTFLPLSVNYWMIEKKLNALNMWHVFIWNSEQTLETKTKKAT